MSAEKNNILANRDLTTRITDEKLDSLFVAAAPAFLFSIINAVLVCAVLWQAVPRVFLLSWFSAILVVKAIRYAIVAHFRAYGQESGNRHLWSRIYIFLVYCSGACWGALALVPRLTEILWIQSFIAFVIAGMSAGGLMTLSVSLAAAIPYIILTLLPLFIRLTLASDFIHLAMGAMIGLYLILLIRVAYHLNDRIVSAIRLEIENEELFSFLERTRVQEFNTDDNHLKGIKWNLLFDLSGDVLCVIGPDGRLERINRAFETATGYAEQELVNKPFIDKVHPDDQAATIEIIDRIIKDQGTSKFYTRYQCKDGTFKQLRWKAATSRDYLYAAAGVDAA